MSNHQELLDQFKGIAGVDDERAKFFLESAAWDLQTALGSFYEGGDDTDDPIVDEPSTPASDATSPTTNQSTAASRILFDDDEDLSDEDNRQAFYAGGSQASGQQVLGPSKKKKDIVSQLFKSAKEHGAEVVEGRSDKPKRMFFGGTGYRLGETEDDTQVIPDRKAKKENPRNVVLKMWKTGFSIDDGPIRDYTDPSNAEFLSAIKRSEVPSELIRQARGGEVFLNLEDHRHEEFSAPKKAAKAFTGSGHTLGSPAPDVVGQVLDTGTPGGATGSTSISKPTANGEEKAKEKLSHKPDQPSTNVQVKLTDGSRLVIKLNQTHTVGDIRLYIQTARPQYQASPFAIMTTFPHAELTDDSQSVKDAKLLNAAVVVKLK